MLFVVFGLIGVAFAATRVPLPSQVHNDQASVLYYSDARTVLARVGAQDRTDVKLATVPKDVQEAVLAAENRDFYSDSGISVKGIARALWADVRGQDLQGGSTITQQYARNAYLTQERSFSRKLKEIVLAVKLDRAYTKNQLLEWYLNTIYFGRGAYGIQAAAQTYFGVPAARLTLEQGGVLASSVRSPAGYDPTAHPQAAQARWSYVLAGMVGKHWITRQRADQARYPRVRPPGGGTFNQLLGQPGFVYDQVVRELRALGISEDQLRRGGLKIVTTIDRTAENAAVNAVRTTFAGQPRDIRQALVAVQPGTGRVVAYYGGQRGYPTLDYAARSYQPGSSIKPYVLATALSQGMSLRSTWDGTSPQVFPDRRNHPVYNSGDGQGEQCGSCTLITATAESLNTVYYALTRKVGVQNAVALAGRAGIRSLKMMKLAGTTLGGKPLAARVRAGTITNGFGIGEDEITPLDQANGYATFANGGVAHDAYFVEDVSRISDGQVLYRHQRDPGRRAFSADVAADATYAMQKVITIHPAGGRFDRRLADHRPAAAKTGTTQAGTHAVGRNGGGNSNAWMVGFTPQLAAAVWVGHDGSSQLLVDRRGRQVYGIGLPALAWRAFMNAALSGQPIKPLPDPVFLGSRSAGDANPVPVEQAQVQPTQPPAPAPGPTATPAPTTTPSPTSSPTPRPTPTRRCRPFPRPCASSPPPFG